MYKKGQTLKNGSFKIELELGHVYDVAFVFGLLSRSFPEYNEQETALFGLRRRLSSLHHRIVHRS